MAGRHGNATSTSQNLEVLKVDLERNLLVIKGAVPGATGSWVKVTPTVKRKVPTARRLFVEVKEAEGARAAQKKPAVKKGKE
jgi:large subunit ribosomal protein L3